MRINIITKDVTNHIEWDKRTVEVIPTTVMETETMDEVMIVALHKAIQDILELYYLRGEVETEQDVRGAYSSLHNGRPVTIHAITRSTSLGYRLCVEIVFSIDEEG